MKKFKFLGGIILLVGIMFTSLVLPPILNVEAAINNTKLVINSNNTISINGEDTNRLDYSIGSTLVGNVKVKLNDNYVTPVLNNGKYEFTLTEYSDTPYQVTVEVYPESGYQHSQNYVYNGTPSVFPDGTSINLGINANSVFNFDFDFEAKNNNPAPTPVTYPVIAYFNGVNNPVAMDQSGSILIPDGWTSGDITFKAKVCINNGNLVPDNGEITCDAGTSRESSLGIEGIANLDQINRTLSGTREHLTVSSEFMDYGYGIIHLTSNEDNINTVVNISTKNLITLTADSPLAMSFSVGSTSVIQAIVTKDISSDLSVFFGNTKTKLVAKGPNVSKITSVTGAKSVALNGDGTASVTFPDLSTETTTKVKVTILLNDDTSVTRTVNLKRTAIMLSYDKFNHKLKAGYVMNKAYLYNNQNHSDNIFNAYLQVILYKDNLVTGFKQVKINDEYIVNNLASDAAWSIETFNDDAIILLDNTTGYTGASVFLTNGPLDINTSNLPSIEFGIGSGVTTSWEAE